ncbi:hypothetical protein [Bifidobacterium miconis]|uniref:hypothetical protein n=1 Tax=Bifidobacterium miconis TaxID=2834435 RepID=UPI001F411D6D|nr:hypothetical protein [Bifidobacterium miconis]
MNRLHGEQVTVTWRVDSGERDGGMNPIWREESETVDDVLVKPGADSNATDSNRPEGVTVVLTLAFPRTWTYRSLRGAIVTVHGHGYQVVGDPLPVDGGITPTRWNLTVELTDSEGYRPMSAHVKLNLAGFTALRRDSRTLGAIKTEAEKLAERANQRARSECPHPEHAKFRALGPIPTEPGAVAIATSTGDPGCYRHNAKHNTLVNALGGG